MDSNVKAKKRKLKKIVTIILIVFASLGILLLALYVVLENLKSSRNTSNLNSDEFFPADYSEDISKDEFYQAKVRGVYYLEFGSGEILTEKNLDSMPDSAKFFNKYFEAVISGNYSGYKSFFTQNYLKNNQIPEKFTKQKIYDIEVNLYDRQNKEVDGKNITIETFIVKYKILDNNGTFRKDMGSNMIVPLVFQLYNEKGNILINGIDSKINK